jgi:CHAT domain-containing protein
MEVATMGPEQRSPVPDLLLRGRERRSLTLADRERLDRLEAAIAEWFESVRGSLRQLEAQEGYQATQAVLPALQRLAAATSWSEQVAVLRHHPELLSDAAERVLGYGAQAATQRANPQLVEYIQTLAAMIRYLRAYGIDTLAQTSVHGSEETGASREEQPADQAEHRRMEAQTLLRLGRAEEALALLDRALVLSRTAGDHAGEGEAELLKWQAYRISGGIGEEHDRLARVHVERAERAFRRAGHRRGLTEALIRLALMAAEGSERAWLEYNLAKLKQLDPAVAAWWRSYTTATLLADSDPDASAEELRHCLDTVEVLGEHVEHWRNECLRKLAVVTGDLELLPSGSHGGVRGHLTSAMLRTLQEGNAAGAMEDLGAAVDAAEAVRRHVRSEATQRELSATLDPIYTAAATLAGRDGRLQEAVDIAEQNTCRSLLSRHAMAWLWRHSPTQEFEELHASDQEIVDCLVSYRRSRTVEQGERLRVALLRRRQLNHEVEEALLGLVPPPHQLVQPVSSSVLQELLAPDEAVVVFTSTDAVYRLDDRGVARVGTLDRGRVETACARYRAHATRPGRGLDSELSAATEELVEACVTPVRGALEPDRQRVVIVPSGPLWGVPLGVLGAAPLCADYGVSYAPSLSVMRRLLELDRVERRVERFVGIADPDGSLPHAASETAAAATHFYDQTVLAGDGIDVPTAVALMQDADIVHVACHGHVFRQFPELSYLHLAGRMDDGLQPLWVQDLVRMRLPARLVVLAACHAGTALELKGGEYIGFPAACLGAGARSVVAPLWAVGDRSTARLMRAFYDELAGHRPPVDALASAQRRLQADPETAHPYHWAAFQMFGLP